MRITTIIKCILNLNINLTFNKLLTLALAVRKQITKAISQNEVV